MPVGFTTVREEAAAQVVHLTGEARPRSQAVIRSQVTGTVTRLLVQEGDQIVPGTVVAILDGADQSLEYTQARAALTRAENVLAELENGTRPEVLRQREAEFEAAAAREREAAHRLEAVKKLGPALMAQKQAAAYSAHANEVDAADNLKRTAQLVLEGALPEREEISVKAAYDTAKSGSIQADYALKAQETENQRDLLAAEAALAAAASERARAEAVLAESRSGPRSEVLAAQRAQVNDLRAQAERAQLDLGRTEIKSVVGGTVSERTVGVGDLVKSEDPVVTVVDREVDAFFQVPEDVSGAVQSGQKCVLEASAFPDWKYESEVVGVVKAAASRSRRQTIRVKAEDDKILPGMSLKGTLYLPREGTHLLVSRDALVQGPKGWRVFTVDKEMKAQPHDVKLEVDLGEEVAITASDLKDGAQVVSTGAPGLTEGSTVIPPQETKGS